MIGNFMKLPEDPTFNTVTTNNDITCHASGHFSNIIAHDITCAGTLGTSSFASMQLTGGQTTVLGHWDFNNATITGLNNDPLYPSITETPTRVEISKRVNVEEIGGHSIYQSFTPLERNIHDVMLQTADRPLWQITYNHPEDKAESFDWCERSHFSEIVATRIQPYDTSTLNFDGDISFTNAY